MGAAASLVSEDQRASMHMAVLEALPSSVYTLEERRFKAGSFYETTEFSPHRKHCPVFAALGLHEWSVSHIWRHFRRVSEKRGVITVCTRYVPLVSYDDAAAQGSTRETDTLFIVTARYFEEISSYTSGGGQLDLYHNMGVYILYARSHGTRCHLTADYKAN